MLDISVSDLVIIGLFLLCIWLTFICYIFPKRQHTRYVKLLKGLGYKVKVLPFRPYTVATFAMFKECREKYNDPIYSFKTDLVGYDVVVENVFNRVALSFIKPDLLKEVFTPDKVTVYHKYKPLIRVTRALFGEGVAFSEDDIWKRKRNFNKM